MNGFEVGDDCSLIWSEECLEKFLKIKGEVWKVKKVKDSGTWELIAEHEARLGG